MVRRAENVHATWQRGIGWFFTGKGYVTVHIGRKPYRRPGGVPRKAWDQMVAISNGDRAVPFISIGERRYWRFEGRWFYDNEDLNEAEIRALLVTRRHLRRATINRAQTIAAMADAPAPTAARGVIPEDLKLLVWTRDQ